MIFLNIFSEKKLDISCELSAEQTIHMKCQALFSLKKKNNKSRLSSSALVGTITVNI